MWEKIERAAKIVGLITGIGAIAHVIFANMTYGAVVIILALLLLAMISLILYIVWFGVTRLYRRLKDLSSKL